MTSDNTRCANSGDEFPGIEVYEPESSSNEHNHSQQEHKVGLATGNSAKLTDKPEDNSLFDESEPSGNIHHNRAPEPRDNVSKCCTAEFIEDSDICSKCKEHSE